MFSKRNIGDFAARLPYLQLCLWEPAKSNVHLRPAPDMKRSKAMYDGWISEARGLWFGWITIGNGPLLFFGQKFHNVGYNFDESSEARGAFSGG
jgi:hypothetical protein